MVKWRNGVMVILWYGKMLKWVISAESLASVPFTFTTTIYQQKNSDRYFKSAVLNISRLAEGSTDESSCSIWDSTEQDKDYGDLHLDCIEVKIGKEDIIMMGGDVCGDWKLDFFHIMVCYAFKMNNCVNIREGSNGGADWVFPKFQEIKESSVVLTMNKIIWVYVGKVGVCKIIDVVGKTICCGSADDMVLNPTLDVLSTITHGGWYFQG